jgi:serine phosphatase RsbU (regulator of sigma subunit)
VKAINKNKRLIHTLIFLSVIFISYCLKAQDTISFSGKSIEDTENGHVLLLRNWELCFVKDTGSLPDWEHSVRIKKSRFLTDSLDLKNYSGIVWFRKKFRTDTSFDEKNFLLEFHMFGAAEVFLNGKLLKKLGKIGSSQDNEKLLICSDEMAFAKLNGNSEYELLIKYSNHDVRPKTKGEFLGISTYIKMPEEVVHQRISNTGSNLSFLMMIVTGFLTLAFLHFVIFLFNRDQKGNIYYSAFCTLVAAIFVSAGINQFATDHKVNEMSSLLLVLSVPILFNILPYMFRAIFRMPLPRWYLAFAGITLLGIICVLLELESLVYLFAPVLLFGIIESARAIIIAFRQKKKGVRIIGAGLLFFLILVIIFTGAIMRSTDISVKGDFEGILLLLFFMVSIFSIPISITIFLAYSISLTNKTLAKKLNEVEELSAKSIEQEKEKQSILENQKAMLEVQVNERTLEIREQKKVIEEKNKDIIDSINYAKRIQSAMLPDESVFKSIFRDAFILYQPRDIVSGDFYYATELEGKKLVLAADCTGHGVPGALMSMVGSNIINKLVHENNIFDPKLLLEKLHEQLRHALKQDQKGSVNRDGMDVAVVLIDENTVIYAGANRPLIYFDTDKQLQEIKPTKTPVGGSHIESVSIDSHSLEKKNIYELFLFSDGFADQFGGPEGKKLMVSKFKTWLGQIISIDADSQLDFLSKNFADWKNTAEQVDDVMVIGIKLK